MEIGDPQVVLREEHEMPAVGREHRPPGSRDVVGQVDPLDRDRLKREPGRAGIRGRNGHHRAAGRQQSCGSSAQPARAA
jgi:hypothetical protein